MGYLLDTKERKDNKILDIQAHNRNNILRQENNSVSLLLYLIAIILYIIAFGYLFIKHPDRIFTNDDKKMARLFVIACVMSIIIVLFLSYISNYILNTYIFFKK